MLLDSLLAKCWPLTHSGPVAQSLYICVLQGLLSLVWTGRQLAPHTLNSHWHSEPLVLQGMGVQGQHRTFLVAAGLSHAEVDHLFRALYTFTVGFQDVLKDLLLHAPQRQRVLHDVWRAFLSISETAAKINFKV